MRRSVVPPLIMLSLIAAIVFAATAFNWAKIAGQLGAEQSGIGSAEFWDAHLHVQLLGFCAFLALLVSLEISAIAARSKLTIWPAISGIIAILCGIAALDSAGVAWSFSQSTGGVGSPGFWNVYLRSHYWAGASFLALLGGLAIAGIAFVVSTSDARHRPYEDALSSTR
ncbi:MAG TPA: hypothetical protein VGD69_18030 [Herpetosiphonaceae bacterium]